MTPRKGEKEGEDAGAADALGAGGVGGAGEAVGEALVLGGADAGGEVAPARVPHAPAHLHRILHPLRAPFKAGLGPL